MATPNSNIIYRTDQSSSLTYEQMDGNFAYLSQSIASITTPESASYALTASYALSGGSGGNIDTSSLATTGSNTFTDNQIIVGNITFPSSSFISTSNESGSLFFSALNEGTLFLNADGGEGDIQVGYNGWTHKMDVRGPIQVTNIQGTGSLYLKPDESDVAERQFEIYNTAPSDIHFKGSATHSFFGDDTNYLKIDDSAATVTIDSTNGLFINSNTTISGDAEFSGSILVSGSIIPNVDGSATSSFDLGSPTAAWKDIYVSNGTINFLDGAGNIQSTLGTGNNQLTGDTFINGKLTQGENVTASGAYSHAEGTGSQALGIASHAEGFLTTVSNDYAHAEGSITVASGNSSHAEGDQTLASGPASHAEGAYTTASAGGSHTEGTNTIASGDYSHAEGWGTTSSGSAAHSEGLNTLAEGPYSHAEGTNTTASGQSSHAEGNFTQAIGVGSHAEGYLTQAIGLYSHAEGDTTTAKGIHSHAEGIGSEATGSGAHAEGNYTFAFGASSHTEGGGTIAIGFWSHAEGYETLTLGNGSHAEGFQTTSSGTYSHAEGRQTFSSGSYSHAEGNYTTASGEYSHAEGAGTIASGFASHAEGVGTIASANYQHVAGKYNRTSSNENDLFIIGNGTNVLNRKNILVASTSSLTVSGSILVSGSIIPNVNGVSATSSFSLGSPTAAWKDIWVSDGTINFVNSAGQIQGTLGAGTNGTVITGSLTVVPKDVLAVDDFSQVVRLHKQQLIGYSFSLWNPYDQERNMGIYSTGYGGAFILPWDRKVSSYYLNNRIPTSSIGDGVEPWVVLPPPFNSGHGPGDIISIYNMSNSTSSLYKSSGSISVFSGWQGITNVDTASMTIDGTFNTGTLLSGSWGNYKNVNINYLSSNPSLSGSIQIAPGQKATFELVVFSANASQNVTRPSNSDLDNYFLENGYSLNQTNVNSTTIALYYLFKGIENL